MKKTPFILLIPIIVLGVFFFLGLGNGIVQSFGYIPAFGLENLTLDYYKEVIANPGFKESLKLSLKIAFGSSILATVLGTLLSAALVYKGKNKSKTVQILKLAIIVPHTIVGLFAVLFLSQNGLLARLFYNLDLISSQTDFPLLLYTENNMGIILAYLWKEIPFVAYFCLSLMSSIDKTLGEAAENLGASKIQSFLHITLPLTMPAILRSFVIILLFSFGAYDLPFILGATLPKALPVQAYIEYTHPDLKYRPYAMAMNGLILLVTWLLAGVFYLLGKRFERGERDEK